MTTSVTAVTLLVIRPVPIPATPAHTTAANSSRSSQQGGTRDSHMSHVRRGHQRFPTPAPGRGAATRAGGAAEVPTFSGHAARSSAASVGWRPAETFALALNDWASDPNGMRRPRGRCRSATCAGGAGEGGRRARVMVGDSTWDCEAAGARGHRDDRGADGRFSREEADVGGGFVVFESIGILHPARRRFVRLAFGGPASPPEVETPDQERLDNARADPGCRGAGHGVDVPHQGRFADQRPREDRRSRALEERRLLVRYHREGDRAAREQLVERCCRSRGAQRGVTAAPTSRSTTSSRSRRSG